MNVEPNDLVLFARIAECGSFSRAAERIGLPKSTVSRRISQLETSLGERLLQRTTRKLVLTEFGLSLLEHARKVVEEVEAAGALVQHRQAAPSGHLRISMPGDFANLVMGPMMAQFMARYPAVTLALDLSPRRVDLLNENFDLAIRMGPLPDDANLAARCIGYVTIGLYAAPGYVARRGLPSHPDELAEHDMLSLANQSGRAVTWKLNRGKTQWERDLPARMTANSPDLLTRVARTGAGITASSDLFVARYVESGELVKILPEWSLPFSTASAVFPGRRLMPAKTRAFLDMMDETLAGKLVREE